jgi:AsmA protein
MTRQGVGVRVGGTASAPSFKLDPRAAIGLIEAGSQGNTTTQPTPKQPASRDKDVLNKLLQNALKPTSSGH